MTTARRHRTYAGRTRPCWSCSRPREGASWERKRRCGSAPACGFDGAQRRVGWVVWDGGRVIRHASTSQNPVAQNLVLQCGAQDKVRRRSSLAAVLFMTKEGRRRSSILRGGGKIAPED
eukprot:7253403-Prymnesium_polylepis.2